jgi:hypothetical protein
MEKQLEYIEDITDRYICQVMKQLTVKNKNDIETELRTLISDMLEDRTGGNPPQREDIDSVLRELGNPYELSEKYSEHTHYLIGPAIYPTYLMVLKIVLYASLLGLGIASALDILTDVQSIGYQSIGSWVADIINGLLASFAWVTLIFIILERKGVGLNKNTSEWSPASLPPTPVRELSIPLRRPIANIAFQVFAAVIFLFAPQILGAYFLDGNTKVIPIFDQTVFKAALPLFLIMITLAILKSIWEILEQKITMKYAIFTTVVDILQLLVLIVILVKFPLWNADLFTAPNTFFYMKGNFTYDELWSKLNSGVIIVFTIIFLIECSSIFYKAVRYGKR